MLLTRVLRGAVAAAHHDGRGRERVSFQDILAFENFVLLTGLILAVQMIERSFGPVLPLYARELGSAGGRVELAAGLLFSAAAVTGALGHQLAATLLRRDVGTRGACRCRCRSRRWRLACLRWSRPLWALMGGVRPLRSGRRHGDDRRIHRRRWVIPRHAHGASFGLLTSAMLIGTSSARCSAG